MSLSKVHFLFRPLAVLLLVPAIACGTGGTGTPETLQRTGTVRFLEVEGGCWAVETAEERFEPINLPEEFREDGLTVRFEGEVQEEMASICQIGPLIRLASIERVED